MKPLKIKGLRHFVFAKKLYDRCTARKYAIYTNICAICGVSLAVTGWLI